MKACYISVIGTGITCNNITSVCGLLNRRWLIPTCSAKAFLPLKVSAAVQLSYPIIPIAMIACYISVIGVSTTYSNISSVSSLLNRICIISTCSAQAFLPLDVSGAVQLDYPIISIAMIACYISVI